MICKEIDKGTMVYTLNWMWWFKFELTKTKYIMCFTAIGPVKVKKVGLLPVYCYKMLDESLKSPLMKYQYQYGVKQPDVAIVVEPNKDAIKEVNFVYEGYHSYVRSRTAARAGWITNTPIVVKCRIPRGATYVKGNHDIVSSSIIILKRIKPKKL